MKIAIINDDSDNSVFPISNDVLNSYIKDGHTIVSNIDLSSLFDLHFNYEPLNYEQIDCVLTSRPLSIETIRQIKPNTIVIGSLNPYWNKEQLQYLVRGQITSFSLDLIVRTAKAQYMDVLSSQSNLAGYKAVIEGAHYLNKTIPLMITTAGTIKAARVLVIGAGVAGLQAIATARRLGARVTAFDVRAAAKEQVKSLGAEFIDIPTQQNSIYAESTSLEYQQEQGKRLMAILPFQDLIVTTAQIPGEKAPVIITQKLLSIINKNSVITDLAYNTGGNCDIFHLIPVKSNSICDTFKVNNGPIILGYKNILNTIWQDASNLYAKNVYAFFKYILPILNKDLLLIQDDIIQSTLLTYHGKLIKEG